MKISDERIGERIVSILDELIATPTPTGQEEELLPYLSNALNERRFDVHEQRISIGRRNLIGKRAEGSLLLRAHMDTFPAYTHPLPYRLRRFGDDLIGRGVVDCKGLIAALLVAVELSDAPCQIAFVSDEERGGLGSKELELDESIKAALVLEPTDAHLIIAHAGSLEFEVTMFGRAAHGAMPQEGENAIENAWALIERLKQLPFVHRTHPLFQNVPLFTLGVMHGGYEPMVVPNRCTFQVDMRVLPGDDLDEALAQVRHLVVQAGGELTILDVTPPVVFNGDERIIKIVAHAHEAIWGAQAQCIGYHSWTDAVNLIQRGIPAIVYGAGHLGDAHSDQEKVKLSDLVKVCKVYQLVLESWN
ncbi:MAG TPA: M20 family peptidase [Armatimonadetes bacterium]|nr:M20 family peptidase [Armatimonadota bacterium]